VPAAIVLLAIAALVVYAAITAYLARESDPRAVATVPPTAAVVAQRPTVATAAAPAPAATGLAAEVVPPAAATRYVRVATNPEYPPFEFVDSEGKLAGFDVELMQAIGREAGFEPEFVQTPFDAILDRLALGDYDAVIAAVTITEGRGELVAFSAPYFETGLVVVVRGDSPYEKPDDVNGHIIGALAGTAGEAQAVSRYGEANVRRFEDAASALRALSEGAVDAVAADMPAAAAYVGANQQAGLRLLPDRLTNELYGIAVRRGNGDLLAAINDALQRLHANGTYDALYRRWIAGGGG
jgi:ABC-type amino acid transport substrate-binding protein